MYGVSALWEKKFFTLSVRMVSNAKKNVFSHAVSMETSGLVVMDFGPDTFMGDHLCRQFRIQKGQICKKKQQHALIKFKSNILLCEPKVQYRNSLAISRFCCISYRYSLVFVVSRNPKHNRSIRVSIKFPDGQSRTLNENNTKALQFKIVQAELAQELFYQVCVIFYGSF